MLLFGFEARRDSLMASLSGAGEVVVVTRYGLAVAGTHIAQALVNETARWLEILSVNVWSSSAIGVVSGRQVG